MKQDAIQSLGYGRGGRLTSEDSAQVSHSARSPLLMSYLLLTASCDGESHPLSVSPQPPTNLHLLIALICSQACLLLIPR